MLAITPKVELQKYYLYVYVDEFILAIFRIDVSGYVE
jgi:hypothetical protein